MQYLILGFFLINLGITVALVSIFNHYTERKIERMANDHLDLIINLARETGKIRAEILEAQNGKR